MKHHHHTESAFVFHHDHDQRDTGTSHLELGPSCDDPACPSLTPKKLVRPGYNVALRVGKK